MIPRRSFASTSFPILLVIAVPLFAVGPVVITDQSGTTQTSRPNMVFRTFQKGDIPHYARAVVGGTPLTTQCDVMTRWPDNSVKQAMVSFVYTIPASGSVTVGFQDQATGNNTGYLDKAAALALSWDAQIQTAETSITKTADARTILTAASSISTDPNSLGVRYWLKGPLVTQVILEDRSTSRVNDFGYTCLTNCTAGIPNAASVSTVDGTFTLAGHTLQNGSLVRIHANTVVSSGPAGFTNDTNYYVVNRTSSTFQLSATSGGSAIVPTTSGTQNQTFWPLEVGGVPIGSATWGSDITNRSLHPIFILTFFAGYAGVKVDYILTNDWTTALQDQRYALTLLGDTGNVTTKLATSEFVHYGTTRWRYTYWSGTPLGDVKIDHGFAYLTGTGMVPNYDPALTVTPTQIATDVAKWNASDKCDPTVSGYGMTQKAMGGTGQTESDWIGLLDAWEARWLYGMGNGSVSTAQFNGPTLVEVQCSANIPMHFRELDSTRWYDSGHTLAANGYPLSMDARPTMYWLHNYPGSDDVIYLTTRSNSAGWTGTSGAVDQSHEPPYGYFPYLMTGDWFALQELYAWAAYTPVLQTLSTAPIGRGPHPSWAYLNDISLQTRGQAWALRTLAVAAVAAPDGSPEKAYFTEKVNYNIKADEGRFGITNGTFPPSDPTCAGYNVATTNDPWCWGNKTLNIGSLNDGTPRISPIGMLTSSGSLGFCVGTRTDINQSMSGISTATCDHPWHHSFLFAAYGFAKDLGLGFGPIVQFGAQYYLRTYLDPTYNPYLSDQNYFVINNPSHQIIQQMGGSTPDATSEVYYIANPARTTWINSDTSGSDYANAAKAALSYAAPYTIDGFVGSNAWAWAVANVPNIGYNGNPKWDMIPRSVCDLNKDNKVNILDVQIAGNQAMGQTPCVSADLAHPGTCDIVDVQRVVDASLGGPCVTGQ